MSILGWFASAFSISGTLFNAKKNIWCWPIWITGNCLWKYYSIKSQQWALLLVWICFTVVNVYAWKEWYKDSRNR